MLRKSKGIMSLILIVMLIFATPVLAAPTVLLDGQQLSFDVPPVIDDGRTLVPLRAIFEAMGATVSWDDPTKTATAVKGDTTVILRIGSTSPTINDQVKQLDVPAKIVNGRTLAPLRFVGEAFGGTVSWDPATQVITIVSVPTSGSAPTVSEQIKVHFIDVGQADSIYIELPNNNDILIDGGNVADGQTITNYLKAQGVDDIELMIATHPHEDHIGGLPAVLDAYQVEKVVDSGKAATSKIYGTYESAIRSEGCSWEQDAYQSYTWGNTALRLYTGSETWEDINDYSVVCRLDTGNIEFLFMGDAETPVEVILQGDIDTEILKVGHHGSASSTSTAFLSRVSPKIAVISVGSGNTYGHPAPETISKLQATGATIYRTDLNGNIVITTDGQTYSVANQKNLPAPAVITPDQTPDTPPAAATGQYVGSSKSDKYHLPSCRYAESISAENQVWFNSEQEALAAGYKPCGVCKP